MNRRRKYLVWVMGLEVVIVLAVGGVITSCWSDGWSDGMKATAVPSLPACGCPEVVLPTISTICPEVTVPSWNAPRPRFFYVLIDNSGSYGEHRDKAVGGLVEALRKGLRGGDEIVIALIGTDPMGEAHLVVTPCAVPVVPMPDLLPTPMLPVLPDVGCTLVPTPTPLPSGIPPAARNRHNRVLANVEQCNQQISLTATAAAGEVRAYREAARRCLRYRWVSSNSKLIERWQEDQKRVVYDVVEGIERDLGRLPPARESTEVYGALFVASDVLRNKVASGKFERVVLLVLSDGEGKDEPGGRSYKFDGVEVVMAMVPYDEEYETRKEVWCRWFNEHGALSCEVYSSWLGGSEVEEVFTR